MIELRIDGRSVEVEDGASVLDAARKAGIYLPTLCHQPDLSPFGGCRMCTVEIEGMRGFPASCTTPARSGMRVRTDTEKLRALRRGVLELLLTEHPSACLVCADRLACWQDHEGTRRAEVTTGCKFCPNHDRCGLEEVVQHVTGEAGPRIELPSRYRAIPVDRRDPFIDWDDNLCILCGRCVRACEELSLASVLDFVHRGSETRVGTAFDRTLLESGCRFCGACVDACPTGTISERARRWDGPAERHVPTTCSFCSVGCQFELGVKNRRVIESLPRKGGGPNDGDGCVRGRFAVVEFTRSVRRLKMPLLRRNGSLTEVPWEVALRAVADGIRRSAPERSAFVYSGSCTNEDVYIAHKFAGQALKTPHVDSSLRLSHGPLLEAPGAGARLARLAELEDAGAVLMVGADPDFSHPILAQKIRRAVDAGRLRLVAMGPGPTGLSSHAECEIRHAPGEELRVLDPLLQRLTGNPVADLPDELERAAAILEGASAVLLYGSGLMGRADAAAHRDRIAALAKATSAKVLPLLSRANDRGAMEIAARLGGAGMTVPEIFAAARGEEIDLLYLMGEDLWPGTDGARFVVVQDMFLPAEAGAIADVVLPAASFTEIEGTYTNLEGRIQPVRRSVPPLAASKADWEILSCLAKELGLGGFDHAGASEVLAELAQAVPFFADADPDALEREPVLFGRSRDTDGAPLPAAEGTRPRRAAAPADERTLPPAIAFHEFAYKATPLGSEVHGLRRLHPAPAAAPAARDV